MKPLLTIPAADPVSLAKVEALDSELHDRFRDRMHIQPAFTRQLVSFQANKQRSAYRWFKYKEAFSATLVEYLIHQHSIVDGPILDPFAGMGTSLFVASAMGLDAEGIELLPIGQEIIQTRQSLQQVSKSEIAILRKWIEKRPWNESRLRIPTNILRITTSAYPAETQAAIEKYLGAIQSEEEKVAKLLRLALLCVLESVSYTRKDGQYLRWDYRAARRPGAKPFNKGIILAFDNAITAKLSDIVSDLEPFNPSSLFEESIEAGTITLFRGSCLDLLPEREPSSYSAIITSPPYCNRYDYTRTYALELALLGVGENALLNLRQQMLSCTVENRGKDLLTMNSDWARAISIADRQDLLQAVLGYLEGLNQNGNLNNTGIPRMVRGYFYEMACVISESARVLKSGGLLMMVNDNVRYAGASVSVDLILADMAVAFGFHVEQILVLPKGKGNSSQQMGTHGRDQLRKCVYVWRKK